MWKLVCLSVVAMFPVLAKAQMSVEEAEKRLAIRQAARMKMAEPTTRPTTLPSSWAAVLAEDEDREASLATFVYQKPVRDPASWIGKLSPMGSSDWAEQPEVFGIGMRGRTPSSSRRGSGGDVAVRGYMREGHWVNSYTRTRPDGNPYNNKNYR
jgi:hypothetical protein